MPNWCENKLLILADNKDGLKDFGRLEKLFEESLDYNEETGEVKNLLDSIVSMPKALKDGKKYTLPNGDTMDWYKWCNNFWGTKWDACNCIATMPDFNAPNRMMFVFDTAWAPPLTWLETVAAIFPNLWIKLRYDEPGIGFRGVACGRGEIIDECEDYEYDDRGEEYQD